MRIGKGETLLFIFYPTFCRKGTKKGIGGNGQRVNASRPVLLISLSLLPQQQVCSGGKQLVGNLTAKLYGCFADFIDFM